MSRANQAGSRGGRNLLAMMVACAGRMLVGDRRCG